jgi:HD-like signal output (HDOD) protein/DNA-binding NarL/FixJ family response regulator
MQPDARTAPTVLLADADPWSRETLAQIVRSVRSDAVLFSVGDGQSALDTWNRQPFALVLAEQNLPGLNGLELLRRMRRQRQPRQAFILFSARVDSASVREVAPLAPTAYLAKPFKPEDLIRRLQELLLGEDDAPAPETPSLPEDLSLERYLEQRRDGASGAPLFVGVQTALERCMNPKQCDLEALAAEFGRDPQITACLIAAANSAARHQGTPCQTLPQALARLGMGATLNLVLGLCLQSASRLDDPRLAGPAQQYCERAQRAAEFGQRLARLLGANGAQCYTAGLLHSLGDLAVLRSLQDWCNAGRTLENNDIERMLKRFGAAFGSSLRIRWRLPLELRQLIAALYGMDTGVYSREALVVNLAGQAARLTEEDDPTRLLQSKAARLLKLSRMQLEAWLQIEPDAE